MAEILRFQLLHGSLALVDLDGLWAAADAKGGIHVTVVKNMHDLLATLAFELSGSQLTHLLNCFRKIWEGSSQNAMVDLLTFIQRLAADGCIPHMRNETLELIWTLAGHAGTPPDIVDLVLAAHIEILTRSNCSLFIQKKWLATSLEAAKIHRVIPMLRHFESIFKDVKFPKTLFNPPDPAFYSVNDVLMQLMELMRVCCTRASRPGLELFLGRSGGDALVSALEQILSLIKVFFLFFVLEERRITTAVRLFRSGYFPQYS